MSDNGQLPRRRFVALLGTAIGAAVTAIVLRPAIAQAEADRPKSTFPTRWIGHN
jgi:hypothetical protein